MHLEGLILDVDGVVTATAVLHEQAWKRLFDPWLQAHGDARPFTHADYAGHVDGKPRHDGIRDFLRVRGHAVDAAEVAALGARKNELFHEVLETDGVRVFGDATRSLEVWREAGLRLAAVSSSRNAGAILERAGVRGALDVLVDGRALDTGLAGKPAPDMFLEAARQLGVAPERAAVLEDAPAGVEAGRRGGFGLVVGVARRGDAEVLMERGAHRVVRTLDELAGELVPPRPPSELPSALDPAALARVLRGRRPALFLDYDGTLTPIVADPKAANLTDDVRAALRQAAERLTVAVVSGRDLSDVQARVGVSGIWYAGSHGFDLAGPGGRQMTVEGGEAPLPELDAADWDKGRAVLWLADALELDPDHDALVYVGDDVTDEDAFRAVLARGAGVLVGHPDRGTRARLRLSDPEQVRAFLTLVLEPPEETPS